MFTRAYHCPPPTHPPSARNVQSTFLYHTYSRFTVPLPSNVSRCLLRGFFFLYFRQRMCACMLYSVPLTYSSLSLVYCCFINSTITVKCLNVQIRLFPITSTSLGPKSSAGSPKHPQSTSCTYSN